MRLGGSIIEVSIRSVKKDVIAFLDDLKQILCDTEFDVDRDLTIIKSNKDEMRFSTKYTMVDLDYDSYDVAERLKELTVREYSETLLDRDDDEPPLLFVFGKDISGRLIYIKLKMKRNKKVVCVSFHYAKWKMEFPYA